ncbi:MAG: ABC transporter ATP-binding protein [Magnetovibrionaceae bacterium]
MLQARALEIGYPNKRLARDINLTVEPGRTLVLLGPNGCGKTTLFKTLMGLLPELGGEVLLRGRALRELDRSEIAKALAYVPQATGGFFPFTAFDTVLMGRTAHLGLFASPGPEDRALALDALAQLGLADLKDQAFTTMSGGQRQLVLIARALAQGSSLIILDEPTASLDFGNQALVLDRMESLRAAGKGLVLSTHDPDQAFRLADRVALLTQTGLKGFGTPEAVLTEDALENVYGIPVKREILSDGTFHCRALSRASDG